MERQLGMEKQQRKKRSSKRKRKSRTSFGLRHADTNTIFTLMVAALSNFHKPNSETLIKKCLNKLRLSLLTKSANPPLPPQQTLPYPILSLLPVLLKSKSADIASRSAKIVGAASLLSFEMNEQIALDGETVKGLIYALASSDRSISIAACNAVLDLSTTSVGQQRLLQFSVVETLMFGFLQVFKSSIALVSLCSMEKGSETRLRIGFKEDEHPILLLDAAITLINSSNVEQLKIPGKLSETFLVYLKQLWAEVHRQMLLGNSMTFSQERHFYLSNIRTNNLAESIFRISINAGQLTTPFPFEVVKRSIFGSGESSIEHFMLNHWEASPFLVRRLSKDLNEEDDIFSLFVHCLNFKETVPSFISSILRSLVSCLPIASDELEILSFLKEVRNKLGCPIIYGQDIRVLKTDVCLKREVHFFQESTGSCFIKAPHVFHIDDILKCEEAYKDGYTIALRGMEFRFRAIATIADQLASLFGQPSVGANIYLTPPDSQGLACHCDDHCVFVCQLLGAKQWTVISQPIIPLPRLYEPLDSVSGSEVGNSIAGCEQFLLREGDVLYIPRGFPHKACTVADDGGPNGTAGFSLHLTLGIEVEPPFEWEGFAHVAVDCWNKNRPHYTSVDSLSGILNVVSVNLLHAVIMLIGDSDPFFRKACLVAAVSLASDTKGWLDVNQRTIFSHLIDRINTESRFLEALRSVEVAFQKNEDPFQRMRWLQLLNREGGISNGHDWSIPSMGIKNFFPLCDRHRDKTEAAFMRIKSKFCSEVVFEDVEESYKMLLEKYKNARKEYMNGMLSLHYN